MENNAKAPALVKCLTLDGSVLEIPATRLVFRPAAYAVLVHDKNVLLVSLKPTGKYHLPGGGIELGERMEAALRREVLEETGIEIQVNRLEDFEELFFYYDPSQKAYHGLHFYFRCTPLSTRLLPDKTITDSSAAEPRWVPILGLKATDFQHGGEKVLAICQTTLNKNEQPGLNI